MNSNRIYSKHLTGAAVLAAATVTLSAGCVLTNKTAKIDASKNDSVTSGAISVVANTTAKALDKGARVAASNVVAVSLSTSEAPSENSDGLVAESEAAAQAPEENVETAGTVAVSDEGTEKATVSAKDTSSKKVVAKVSITEDSATASTVSVSNADALNAEAIASSQQAELDALAAQEASSAQAEEAAAIEASAQAEAEAQALAQTAEVEVSSAQAAIDQAAQQVSDQALLAALIQCEAGNECYDGQVAVGAVVINRLNSGFAGNIHDVIYQKSQFGPAGRGQVASVLAAGPKATCMQAAADALAGVDPTGGAKYFCRAGRRSGVTIGNHVFY